MDKQPYKIIKQQWLIRSSSVLLEACLDFSVNEIKKIYYEICKKIKLAPSLNDLSPSFLSLSGAAKPEESPRVHGTFMFLQQAVSGHGNTRGDIEVVRQSAVHLSLHHPSSLLVMLLMYEH